MLDITSLPPRIRRADAAAYLLQKHGIKVAISTLARWAVGGGGPRFQKINNRPLYPLEELDSWAINRLGPVVSSTSELANAR